MEFDNFAHEYEFVLRKSSPKYLQSNGRVENSIKTAKQLIKRAISSDTDFYLAVLDWRNTLTEGMEASQHNESWAGEQEHRCHNTPPET